MSIQDKAKRFSSLQLVSGVNPIEPYIQKHYGKVGMARYKLARYLLQKMNLVPSDDMLLMLSCTSRARVVIACAGAGKTTSLQVDLCISKLLDKATHLYRLDPMAVEGTDVKLPRILYLNYNKHNVNPILRSHEKFVGRTNAVMEESITAEIESSTVHAFCHKWLEIYADLLGCSLEIVSDAKKQELWSAVMPARWKKFYGDEPCNVSWEVLESLYVFKEESLYDWDEFYKTSKFVDTRLKPEFVKSCVTKYGSMKKTLKLVDFTDYLTLMIDLLDNHPEVRVRLQEQYRFIIADENQDFTALMNALLLRLYNPKVNRLIVVGDPDQTIYAFKGVSSDNVVDLVESLEDVSLLGLDTNYRCPNGIVEPAKRILDRNVLRFDKPLKSVKTGGIINVKSYAAIEDEAVQVLHQIEMNGEDSYGKTVVCYRNNKSSLIIGEELYYRGIPVKVVDDKMPFNNIVFKHIMSCLYALKSKTNIEQNKHLYRFLPIGREAWADIVQANENNRTTNLLYYSLPDKFPAGLDTALNRLQVFAQGIDTAPCSSYVPELVGMYEKYFYNFFMMRTVGTEDRSYYEKLPERVRIFWNRPLTYTYIVEEYSERIKPRTNAVTLSTFHGLKGLEFEHVIALDFNESIFPNIVGIQTRYEPDTAAEEIESENRLCYVLVTRAIKDLTLMCAFGDESTYVRDLVPEKQEIQAPPIFTDAKAVQEPEGSLSSKLSFIKRITRGR